MSYLFKGGDYLIASVSGSQTTNLTSGSHVEFNVFYRRGTSISCATTGSGQQNGIFTLAPNKVYELYFSFLQEINEGSWSMLWSNADGSNLADATGKYVRTFGIDNIATDTSTLMVGSIILAPTESISIKLNTWAATNPVSHYAGSKVYIKEI